MSVISTKEIISLNVYQINHSQFYIATNCREIDTVNLYKALSQLTIFPKVFWQFRESCQKHALFGKLLEFSEAPFIQHLDLIQGDKIALRAFGGEAFSKQDAKVSRFTEFPNQYFFLPQYEMIQNEDSTLIYEHQLFQARPHSIDFEKPLIKTQNEWPGVLPRVAQSKHLPSYEQWVSNVNDLIKEMTNGPLKKVVLFRETSFDLSEPIDSFQLMETLTSYFKNSTFFCFKINNRQSFCGATPEVLYTRQNDRITTEALAGTCAIENAKNLLESFKELDEFEYVSRFFIQELKKITQNYHQAAFQERSTGYLKHLVSSFEGQLKPKIQHQQIVQALFPSSALCGTPQNLAHEYLLRHEQISRGWFAAPMGWIGENSAEFAIAIRSCLETHDKIHLFVANGITKNSDAHKEWDELNIKMQPFFEVLRHES